MNPKIVEEINEWFSLTDLNELTFKSGDFKISLVKKGYFSNDIKINSNLIPVFAQEVGVFSFSKKGKSIEIKKGDKVKRGDLLGYINLPAKAVEVKAPCDGVIRLVAIEDGKVVEYGQLLFVIE